MLKAYHLAGQAMARARNKALSPADRTRIASLSARTRWDRPGLEAITRPVRAFQDLRNLSTLGVANDQF